MAPVAVGRDARVHSPELAGALIDGLRDEGLDVLDLGLVATPMTTAVLADPERADYFRRRAHTGTLGAPSDFAAAAVFLAGPGSAFVTGQNLCVGGGLSVT